MKVAITNTLEKYAQVISVEMMNALRASAQERGVSLDMEIALRLMTSMVEPELGQGNTLFNQIMRTDFPSDTAVSECKRKRHGTQYVYEIEKLRLYLCFEKNLPRNTKETFKLIDVKAETKRIKAEMEAEEKANRDNDANQGE